MLEKAKICIDIDNTVADVNTLLSRHFKKPIGTEYNFLNLKPEWFEENLWVFRDALPMRYSKEVLSALSNYFEIVYLTKRSKLSEDVTRWWLKGYGYPCGDIVFSLDKVADMRKMDAHIAVDDCPMELDAFSRAGIIAMAPVWSYNLNKGYDTFTWKEWLYRLMGGACYA